MKLLSCHIINFGTISDFTYNFSDNLNSIFKDNGEGKSTFASFIKVMFYGMETLKANITTFKDREHYTPFNNGKFGGSIDFEHDKNIYHVERIFDIKSATKDAFTLYINNKKTNYDSHYIESFLKLDEESFEKLVFISSKDITISSTGNIKQSLNAIIDDSIEGVNFSELNERIDENKKKFANSGKKSVNVILINEKNSLEGKRKNLLDIKNSLEIHYADFNKIKKRIHVLEEEQTKFNSSIGIKENLKTLKEKEVNLNNEKKELEELNIPFKKGIPDDQEIIELKNLFQNKNEIKIKIDSCVLNKEKEERFNVLSNIFSNGVPSLEEMDELYILSNDYNRNVSILKEKKEVGNNEEENLDSIFKEHVPTEQELNDLKENIDELKNLSATINTEFNINDNEKDILKRYSNKKVDVCEEELNSLINKYKIKEKEINGINVPKENFTSRDDSSNKNNKGKKLSEIILLATSLIITFAGVGLIFVNQIAGILSIVAGILILIGDGFLIFKKQITNLKSSPTLTSNELDNKKKELQEIHFNISNCCSPFEINLESPYSMVERFKQEISLFRSLKKRKSNFDTDLDEAKTKAYKLENAIINKLEPFKLKGDYEQQRIDLKLKVGAHHSRETEKKNQNIIINNLEASQKSIREKMDFILNSYKINFSDDFRFDEFKSRVNDYNSIKADIKNTNREKEKLEENLKTIVRDIRKIEIKYELELHDDKSLDELLGKINDIQNKIKQIEKDKGEIEKFKINKNLLTLDESLNDLIDHSEEITTLKADLRKLDSDIVSEESQVSDLDIIEERLAEISEQIKNNKEHYQVFSDVQNLFKEAQSILDEKYVKPVFDKFKLYLEQVGKITNYDFKMTRDFSMELVVDGQYKSDLHLSSGQRTICALCFRLAMLDNIYNGNPPFVIMDDPFMTLDENNMKVIEKFIEELSKKKQIIYFTCHKSRVLK